MRETLLKNLNQNYVGWELYWCVAVITVAVILFSLRAWYYYRSIREKNDIIQWNTRERLSLEKIIEERDDSINSLREKVRYYKGLSKNKNYRKP